MKITIKNKYTKYIDAIDLPIGHVGKSGNPSGIGGEYVIRTHDGIYIPEVNKHWHFTDDCSAGSTHQVIDLGEPTLVIDFNNES